MFVLKFSDTQHQKTNSKDDFVLRNWFQIKLISIKGLDFSDVEMAKYLEESYW